MNSRVAFVKIELNSTKKEEQESISLFEVTSMRQDGIVFNVCSTLEQTTLIVAFCRVVR